MSFMKLHNYRNLFEKNFRISLFLYQVELILDVEFTLPMFMRKRFFLKKEKVQINKYRGSNFIVKFFMDNQELTAKIAGIMKEEEVTYLIERNYP